MSERGIWYHQLLKYILVGSIGVFILILLIYGFNEEGNRQLIQWSGRFSLILFCMAFSASALHIIFKKSMTWYLLMNRKFLGVGFGLIHLIHLAFIGLLQLYFYPIFEEAPITTFLGGGIAYVFVVLMLVTSLERVQKSMNPKLWKGLHTIGGYWIWSIFLIIYWGRAQIQAIHWLPIILLLCVLAIRIIKLVRK